MVAIIKLLVFALTASATPLVPRDAVTVENDITQKIGPQFKTLDTDLNGFPASGLEGALDIAKDLQIVISTMNQATRNIQSTGSFGEADGTTILANLQAHVPLFLATLGKIGSQEPAWATIPGGQDVVLRRLKSLNTAFSDYTNAIIRSEPLLLEAAALAIKAEITLAFKTAIDAYSS
jgi:hypothetical protein